MQHAATEVLVKKICKALIDTGREGIILAGGVAANKLLREKISTLQQSLNIKVLYPPIAHCTDNAAMIAYLGMQSLQHYQYNAQLVDTKL